MNQKTTVVRRTRLVVLLLGLVVILIGIVPTVSGLNEHNETDHSTIYDSHWNTEVRFDVSFSQTTSRVTVQATNVGSQTAKTGIGLWVDGERVHNKELNLSTKEAWSTTWNVSSEFDALEEDHTVALSTYGDRTQFNFTRSIDASKPGLVDVPKIANVTVANGKIEGEQSTVAYVTIENPSVHPYSTKLMIHTTRTDGSFYLGSAQPNNSSMYKVELLDPQGSLVIGEARLYTGKFNEREGGVDQVEFAGRANGNTTHWHEPYEAVGAPWGENPYHYENETLEERFTTPSGPVDEYVPASLRGWPLLTGAGVILVALLLLGKRRL